MTDGMTPADIAACTGGGCNNGMWDNGAWWIIVLFLFACNGSWGGGLGGGNATTQADLQRGFDTNTIINKLNGLENGLCDGFYAMNTGLLNGFSGVNQNVTNVGFGIQNAIQADTVASLQNTYALQNAINADTVANMQNANALSAQFAQCCCENKAALADIKYQMASDTCATSHAIENSTRQIMDALAAQTLCAKNERIAEQNQRIWALELAASQQAQNAYLIERLAPTT